MAERWFFVQGAHRRGPFPLERLIASLKRVPDPTSTFVWRKGLGDWTRAGALPELAQQLHRSGSSDPGSRSAAAAARGAPPSPRPAPGAGSKLRSIAVAAAVVVVLALLLGRPWSRFRAATNRPADPEAAGSGPASPVPSPAAALTTSAPATPAPPPAAGPSHRPSTDSVAVADRESELPRSELPRLRGVGAWSGATLKLTVYNGTSWRVTELQVRIGRFTGEDFVEDLHPVTLKPPEPRVDAGVADLLSRVAPDRKKPGLNALDTGPFEAEVGPTPEAFRWEIVSARGYPPRRPTRAEGPGS